MKTIAYLTVTGLALVQGAHIRGKSTSGSPGITGADVPATGDANTYDPAMTTGDSDTMDYSGATGASDATIPDPLDTGMPATSYANDPAMMGTHASTVAPAVSDASGSSDATIPNPLDTVEAVDICADKHEDHWGTFLFYLSASWLLHAM